MKASVRDNLIRLTALAVTMIPYRYRHSGETKVYESLLFRYTYDRSKKPALNLQKNK